MKLVEPTGALDAAAGVTAAPATVATLAAVPVDRAAAVVWAPVGAVVVVPA